MAAAERLSGIPSHLRGKTFGGVRIEATTRRAPPSTRKAASSLPVFPGPTTSTSRPRKGSVSWKKAAWVSSPVKPSLPAHSGVYGTRSTPVATTASGAW